MNTDEINKFNGKLDKKICAIMIFENKNNYYDDIEQFSSNIISEKLNTYYLGEKLFDRNISRVYFSQKNEKGEIQEFYLTNCNENLLLMLLLSSVVKKDNTLISIDDSFPYNSLISNFLKKYPNIIDIYGSNLINYEWVRLVSNMDNVVYERTCLSTGDSNDQIHLYVNKTKDEAYEKLDEYINTLLTKERAPINSYEKSLLEHIKSLKFITDFKEYKWEIVLNPECLMHFLNNILKKEGKTLEESLYNCGFEILPEEPHDFFFKKYRLRNKKTERIIFIYLNAIPDHASFDLISDHGSLFDNNLLLYDEKGGVEETKV
jgi:hypothetical protein